MKPSVFDVNANLRVSFHAFVKLESFNAAIIVKDGDVSANPIYERLSERLRGHLQALTGPRDPYLNSGKHSLAQQYIRSELGRWGDVSSQSFSAQNLASQTPSRPPSQQKYYNWQTVLPGTRSDLAPILVGAHYDTVPGSPGADDNASGVAVLLAISELLSARLPRRPVHLIAFDLEEYGLVGSTTCAQSWQSEQRPIHLMLSLEMLGYFSHQPQQYPLKVLSRIYPKTSDFLALIGTRATVPKMMSLKRQIKRAGMPCQWLLVLNKGKQIPFSRNSDHAPFWDAGYPAVLVTDTANLRNPHYHTASDQTETLDIEAMAKITVGLAASLRQM